MLFLASMEKKKKISWNVIMIRRLKISAHMKHRQAAVIFCEQPLRLIS